MGVAAPRLPAGIIKVPDCTEVAVAAAAVPETAGTVVITIATTPRTRRVRWNAARTGSRVRRTLRAMCFYRCADWSG